MQFSDLLTLADEEKAKVVSVFELVKNDAEVDAQTVVEQVKEVLNILEAAPKTDAEAPADAPADGAAPADTSGVQTSSDLQG